MPLLEILLVAIDGLFVFPVSEMLVAYLLIIHGVIMYKCQSASKFNHKICISLAVGVLQGIIIEGTALECVVAHVETLSIKTVLVGLSMQVIHHQLLHEQTLHSLQEFAGYQPFDIKLLPLSLTLHCARRSESLVGLLDPDMHLILSF